MPETLTWHYINACEALNRMKSWGLPSREAADDGGDAAQTKGILDSPPQP